MQYYNSFNEYLKKRFGCKVYKVPVSIGASCPNRKDGLSGCTYCDFKGSASPLIEDTLPLHEQIKKGISWAIRKYQAKKFIVYFQPFTNTFVPLNHLCEAAEVALQLESVVGIAIGTRPDCVPDEMLEAIRGFTKKADVWLELGLQSAHQKTLISIKRGHALSTFIDAVLRTKKMNTIFVAAHMIIGLPGETRDEIIETARILAALPIDGIKIHLLHILKESELAQAYHQGKCEVLSLKQYASLVVDVIEQLPKSVVIQRITAEAEQERLVAPLWCLNKQDVIKAIHQEFDRRKSYQGNHYGFGLSVDEIERRTFESIPSKLGGN
jgi:radical SAM protein (TIGR01212 family)